MQAVIYDGELRLDPAVPRPDLTGDQALLKIRKAGICNTDLELMAGYMGFSGILGHEFVADVAEVPQGAEEWLGQRVVGEINVPPMGCTCAYCGGGVPSQCENRVTVGIDRHPGAFADYMALTVRNLYAVPESVSDEAAVFAEPLAAALQILEAVQVSPRHRVVVIGIGKLGALVAQVLRLTGADVIGLVRREAQAKLLQNCGIQSAEREAIANSSADVVVDCTGTAEGFSAGLDIVKPRGAIVLKSTYTGTPTADLTRVAVDEIRVMGSRCGPFGAALRLLERNLIDTQSLVEACYPLAQVESALEHASRRGVLKVLLEPNAP